MYELINVVVALCPNFCLIGTFRGIAFQFRESVHLDLRLYREVFVCSPIMWSGSPSARKLLRAIEAWALGRMLRRVHTVTQHRLALDTDAHGKRFSSFFLFLFLFSFFFLFCPQQTCLGIHVNRRRLIWSEIWESHRWHCVQALDMMPTMRYNSNKSATPKQQQSIKIYYIYILNCLIGYALPLALCHPSSATPPLPYLPCHPSSATLLCHIYISCLLD